MAEPSKRITGLTGGGSGGWDVFFKARAMIAAGAEVIELTVGEHDRKTPEPILKAMAASAHAGHTGYAPIPGTGDLRARIAQRVAAQSGVPTTVDNVVVTPGGQAALFAAHNAVLDPGDTALFIDPYYATYPGTIRGAGGIPRTLVTRAEAGFQPEEAALDAAARGARSLLINSPNNPTGAVYGRETLAAIARVCAAHDLWLISDEVYDTQVWNGEHVAARSLPGMARRTLQIGSMSKSHAMTGSRIGWIVGPEEIVAHIINFSTHTTYGVPGYIQDAATFALDQGPVLEMEIAAPFRRRRALALRIIGGQNRFSAVAPDGAMYVMLDIRPTGLSGEEFANRLLDETGIAVMPGESFGAAAAGHLRIALTVEDDTFATALTRLLAFAEAIAVTR